MYYIHTELGAAQTTASSGRSELHATQRAGPSDTYIYIYIYIYIFREREMYIY